MVGRVIVSMERRYLSGGMKLPLGPWTRQCNIGRGYGYDVYTGISLYFIEYYLSLAELVCDREFCYTLFDEKY